MGTIDSTWRKSSYSGTSGGNCVEVATWRKSSHSGTSGGGCVETANSAAVILVRDTTNRDGFTLSVPADAWSRFTDSLR